MDKIGRFLRRPEIRQMLKKSIPELFSKEFPRDRLRPMYYDRDAFYAPADGFVLYAKVVKPYEEILPVKGGTYSVNMLTRKEIKEECIAIGIYMTILDVHIQRMPTNGIVYYEHLPRLKVMNLSMRPIETALLDRIGINPDDLKYEFYNERRINTIATPYDFKYHVVLTGDFEVDVICNFAPSGKPFTQCERFSLVRMGSQADLIVPLVKGMPKLEILIPQDDTYHIEGGVDRVIRIKRG